MNDHLTHASGRQKNVCTSAVLVACGIDESSFKYAQHRDDVKNVMRRNGLSVRSRMSSLPKTARTMAGLKRWLAAGNGEEGALYYVGTDAHALLLDNRGTIVVDTAPRKSDRRKIRHISAVFGTRRSAGAAVLAQPDVAAQVRDAFQAGEGFTPALRALLGDVTLGQITALVDAA